MGPRKNCVEYIIQGKSISAPLARELESKQEIAPIASTIDTSTNPFHWSLIVFAFVSRLRREEGRFPLRDELRRGMTFEHWMELMKLSDTKLAIKSSSIDSRTRSKENDVDRFQRLRKDCPRRACRLSSSIESTVCFQGQPIFDSRPSGRRLMIIVGRITLIVIQSKNQMDLSACLSFTQTCPEEKLVVDQNTFASSHKSFAAHQ